MDLWDFKSLNITNGLPGTYFQISKTKTKNKGSNKIKSEVFKTPYGFKGLPRT